MVNCIRPPSASGDELRHYGVPGMKWGKRKAKAGSSSKDYKKQRKNLEKQYGELEDQLTYGKKADAKKNASISKRMKNIETQLNRMDKAEREAKAKKGKSAAAGVLAGAIAGMGARSLGFNPGISAATYVVAKQKAKRDMEMYDEMYKKYR